MTVNDPNPPSPEVESRAARSGLSDLAVSPFGLPLALHAKEVRVAWVGRTSTEEHQDPRQSLLRQLERSKVALPESWVIVCHFYDVESGRMELEMRGQGTHDHTAEKRSWPWLPPQRRPYDTLKQSVRRRQNRR